MDFELNFNGVNGGTGQPLTPPANALDLAEAISKKDKGVPEQERTLLSNLQQAFNENVLGVRAGFDETDVADVGWGVIYHPNTPTSVRAIIADLLAHRQSAWEPFIYVPGESVFDFHLRHKHPPGLIDPEILPYYLLIVAAPTEISFTFQYELREHAVGRLFFGNPQGPNGYDVAAFRRYVDGLIAYEEATAIDRQRRVAVFAPTHENDPLIDQTVTHLAKPLLQKLENNELRLLKKLPQAYRAEPITDAAATRAALLDLLGRGTDQPAMIFSTSHGIGFDSGHQRQASDQGGLLCAEWPGSKAWTGGEVPATMYVRGQDVSPDLDLSGLIMFSYACYSAGTPRIEDFAQFYNRVPRQIAPAPFMSALPQRLLAQGALAFVGHVERTWSYSYGWPGVGYWTGSFEDSLQLMLVGKPIGCATQTFKRTFLDLLAELTNKGGFLEKFEKLQPKEKDVVRLWTAANDARAFVICGDPAARLRPARMAASGA